MKYWDWTSGNGWFFAFFFIVGVIGTFAFIYEGYIKGRPPHVLDTFCGIEGWFLTERSTEAEYKEALDKNHAENEVEFKKHIRSDVYRQDQEIELASQT